MAEGNLLAVNAEDCPKTDNVIIADDCVWCKHKVRFQMFESMLCVRCKYLDSEENKESK